MLQDVIMPELTGKCPNVTVLQTENNLFYAKFDQFCPKIVAFRPFCGLHNAQKLLAFAQLC